MKHPHPHSVPLQPQPCPQHTPFLSPHCNGLGRPGGSAQGLQPCWGAGLGQGGPGPDAFWPQLALCPPCLRASRQDQPYMAEAGPAAAMFPLQQIPTNPP